MSDLQPKPRWQDQRYLSEHWGPTMAAQSGLAVDEYRAAVVERLRDLLVQATFTPPSIFAALGEVAAAQRVANERAVRRAREDRNERMKAASGCPVCADSEHPDPTTHADFHARMAVAR